MSKELAGPKPTITFTHPLPIDVVLTFLRCASMARMTARDDRRRMSNHEPGSDVHVRLNQYAQASEERAQAYLRAANVSAARTVAQLFEQPKMPFVDPLPVMGMGGKPRMSVEQIVKLGAEAVRLEGEKGFRIFP